MVVSLPAMFRVSCRPFRFAQQRRGRHPSDVNADDDFEEARKRREIRATLSAERHQFVKDALFYDRAERGGTSRGRPLCRPWLEIGVEKGDRLDMAEGLWKNGDLFDSWSVFLVTVRFWLLSCESLCTFRCPLFVPDIDISPRTVSLDVMHTSTWVSCSISS